LNDRPAGAEAALVAIPVLEFRENDAKWVAAGAKVCPSNFIFAAK
jgi:hypothetical protein